MDLTLDGAASAVAGDQEACATCHRLAGISFPWDMTRSLELALLKTFCLPSISGLLQRSGEFEARPRKRYDDTGLMVAELLRQGPDSTAGAAVIERMNRIHSHFAISNDDYLYVLSTFVAEPIRWMARYGWRPLTPLEQDHLFRFWAVVGTRMGIAGIPPSLSELLERNSSVEVQHFRYAASNQRIADATLAMLLDDWPAPLRPIARRLLMGLLTAPVADSLGWSEAPSWVQRLVLMSLKLRSCLAAALAHRRPPGEARFYSDRPTPSYGRRFSLGQLGPPALLARLNSPAPNAPWDGREPPACP